MLFDQIPSQIKKRIAAELKIDLGVFSTTIKTLPDSETTISKLQLVLKHLEREGEIGDVCVSLPRLHPRVTRDFRFLG